jgi:hypothetical protein
MKKRSDRVISLTLLAALALPFPLAAQESSVQGRAGELMPAATVDFSQSEARSLVQAAPLNGAVSATVSPRPRGARLPHPKNPVSPSSAQFSRLLNASPSNTAEGAPIFMDVEHSRGVLHNFDGVSSLDSAVTNFGAEFEPPDQGLCVGNGFVIEPVNSAFTIYRRNGAVVAGPFNVNALFDEGLTQFTSDPRCYFDAATNTWFATILFISADNTEARTDIAVNSSGDPTTPWMVYHLEETDDGTSGTPVHVGCPCFGDQPLLGIDGENIYISTNEFSILGPQVNGAQVYAVSKRDLIRGSAHVHFVQFENLSIAGNQAFSVQPAITLATGDGADAEYFLESIDPSGISDNRLGVWALTRQESVSDGGIPTLTNVVITSEVFGSPPNAVQKGSASLLNTGDDRMQQAQFIGGELWGALNTTFSFGGDPTQLSANAWFKIHPQLEGHRIAGAAITNQGYLASAGNFLLYPAIQVSPEGDAAMVFTFSGPDFFPGAAYALLPGESRSFGRIRVVAGGSGPYDPNATRWGDYSFAIADPSGDGIWMATEYIPPAARQTVDGLRNWGTRVFEVSTGED